MTTPPPKPPEPVLQIGPGLVEIHYQHGVVWGLAILFELDVDLGELRPTFDELADAMLVWAGDAETEELSAQVLETVWSPELETAIRVGLEGLVEHDGFWRRHARLGLTDLAQNGRASKIAHAAIQRVAMELSHEDSGFFFCICCVDEGISNAAPAERRRIALEAATLACRDAGVPSAELRAALRDTLLPRRADRGRRIARVLATDSRRLAVRARFDRLARLGHAGVPAFSSEVGLMLEGGLPADPDDDELWQATCVALLDRLDADAN